MTGESEEVGARDREEEVPGGSGSGFSLSSRKSRMMLYTAMELGRMGVSEMERYLVASSKISR